MQSYQVRYGSFWTIFSTGLGTIYDYSRVTPNLACCSEYECTFGYELYDLGKFAQKAAE